VKNIADTNAKKTEKGLLLNSPDHYLTIKTEVNSDGYYMIDLGYAHDDWESFMIFEVTHPDGEITKFMQGLLHGKSNMLIPIFFKTGENSIRLSHHFCLGTQIYYIKNVGKAENLQYDLSPKNVVFFTDRPKSLKTTVKNYKKIFLDIQAENGTHIPFEAQSKGQNGHLATMTSIYPDVNAVASLGVGEHILSYCLDNGTILKQKIEIQKTFVKSKLQIINFDVKNANSTLIFLPNGKTLLIDSATERGARDTVIPYLKRHSIKLDYYLLTHFHNDHQGLKDEILYEHGIAIPDETKTSKLISTDKKTRYKYLKNFRYLDSTMLCFYDELHKIWDLGGVQIEVLNSRYDEKGEAVEVYYYPFMKKNEHNYENYTSVSFMLSYNDFRYYHGADNYAVSQERYISDMVRAKRTNDLKCDWFFANHHFVCDISPTFINTLNPIGVYVANEYIYHRAMFAHAYKENVENYYFSDKRLKDTLVSEEVGTAKVYVNSGDDWYYETIQNEDL